jgi:hypothetical protein
VLHKQPSKYVELIVTLLKIIKSIMTDDEIKVCDCGDDDVLTPLLWTFKFPGAEYWCPRCGYTAGMLGPSLTVPLTPELVTSKTVWEAKSRYYLDDNTKNEWEYDTEF